MSERHTGGWVSGEGIVSIGGSAICFKCRKCLPIDAVPGEIILCRKCDDEIKRHTANLHDSLNVVYQRHLNERIRESAGEIDREMLASLATPISADEAECIIPDSAKKRIAEYLKAEGRDFLSRPYRGE